MKTVQNTVNHIITSGPPQFRTPRRMPPHKLEAAKREFVYNSIGRYVENWLMQTFLISMGVPLTYGNKEKYY